MINSPGEKKNRVKVTEITAKLFLVREKEIIAIKLIPRPGKNRLSNITI